MAVGIQQSLRKYWVVVIFSAVVAFPAGARSAYVATDNNAMFSVDPNIAEGMYTWEVDGVDHLFSQWFWYRVGDTGGETDVSTLILDAVGTTDTNFDGDDETLYLRYLGTNFSIELTFLLAGGTPGSGTSDIAESIKIINTSTTEDLAFHFFQYCDLNLNGTIVDDLVQILGGNTTMQTEGSSLVSETVNTPTASHYEVGMYPATFNSLQDAAPTTLADIAGPIGPGDLTWAFQWDFDLLAGGTLLISKDKSIVPEPATLSLLAVGGLAIMRRKRRG